MKGIKKVLVNITVIFIGMLGFYHASILSQSAKLINLEIVLIHLIAICGVERFFDTILCSEDEK